MTDTVLLQTLTGSLAAALVLGYLTFRLGLSPVVGYLLAGVVVGPYTPGFVANRELAGELAEVGVVLLMFGVGMQFHLKELLDVRRVAVPAALAQAAATTVLGLGVGLAQGWGVSGGLVFGLAVSVASTVVMVRVLSENRDLHGPVGRVAVGWLVVEDLATVLVLVLMPALFGPDRAGGWGIAWAVGVATLKLAALVGLTLAVGDRLILGVLERAAATRSRELFTLTVLVVALGIAVGAARLFGASLALGAFLAGVVVGRSEFGLRAASEALPMRDAFAVLFFVSVGLLFDPKEAVRAPGLLATTLALVLVAKPLASWGVALLLGQPSAVAAPLGLARGQVGEFSFILAATARGLGVLDDHAAGALVAAALVSITLNPLLYRLAVPALRRLGPGVVPVSESPEVDGDARPGAAPRAVVVGYGPVGRTLTRLLLAYRFEPVVVELNRETVRSLAARGIRAVYGDAARPETLTEAGVATAPVLVLSSSTHDAAGETVRIARELNPGVRIFARSSYLREAEALKSAGADAVFSGEGEVALAMTESVLRRMGATPEQLDRERDRIRAELIPAPDDDGAPLPVAPPAATMNARPDAPPEPA